MEKKTRLRDLQQIHRAHNTYCESMGQFRIPFRDCQTKGLLVLLQEARILRQREITYLKEQKTRPGYQDYVKDWEDEDRKYHEEEKMRLEVVIEALKKELSTREHVPNSIERKEIRKKRAQTKA